MLCISAKPTATTNQSKCADKKQNIVRMSAGVQPIKGLNSSKLVNAIGMAKSKSQMTCQLLILDIELVERLHLNLDLHDATA